MGVEHWKEGPPLTLCLSFNSSWAPSTQEPWSMEGNLLTKSMQLDLGIRERGKDVPAFPRNHWRSPRHLSPQITKTPVPSAFPTAPVDTAVTSLGNRQRGWSCEHCVGIMKKSLEGAVPSCTAVFSTSANLFSVW